MVSAALPVSPHHDGSYCCECSKGAPTHSHILTSLLIWPAVLKLPLAQTVNKLAQTALTDFWAADGMQFIFQDTEEVYNARCDFIRLFGGQSIVQLEKQLAVYQVFLGQCFETAPG